MNLNTIEKFLLMAHHPVKGRFRISDLHLNYGIVGAILLELSHEGHLILENKSLVIANEKKFDNEVIQDASEMIKATKKKRKVRYWVTKLERCSKSNKRAFIKDMQSKELFRIEHKKFLGIISYRKTWLTNYQAQEKLVLELKDKVLEKKDLSFGDIAILSLVEACKMHRILTTNKEELKKLKKELKIIIKECPIAEVVDKTIKEVQAAIIAAISASAAASAAASAS